MSEKRPPPETPFQKFEELARKVVSVPRDKIERREKEWKQRNGNALHDSGR